MKKIFLILVITAFAGTASLAAQDTRVKIDSIRVELTADGRAEVSFTMEPEAKSVGSRNALHYMPEIYGGGKSVKLPGILVEGKRAKIIDGRDEVSRRLGIDMKNTRTVSPGGLLRYSTAVPYEDWMAGAELRFEIIAIGCNMTSDFRAETIAENLFRGDTARIVRTWEIEPEYVAPPKTVADIEAERFSFVAHISEFEKAREDIVEGVTFDDNMLLHLGKAVGMEKQGYVEKFVERNKPGSLIIYYRQNRTDIDPDYMDNHIWLRQLIDAVKAIEASADSRVLRLVIAGFASPEGTPDHNDMLAWERAQTMKNLITEKTMLDEDKIRVYNGSEDWLGLRSMVESSILSIKEKEDVLRIIDTLPREEGSAKDGRLGELQRLNGGRTYKYLYENIFPELRNAAYIKVYYENIY